jgi:4-aminobutyrate aminotransferase-like enzyme
VTFIDPDGTWPIVWEKAKGSFVRDAEGKRYLDLTAAFGVAAAGHANPRVIKAGQRQMDLLVHAMGDVHPHALKAKLARELSRVTFERWRSGTGKAIFCNSGFEAVEAALKTAILATGRSNIIAFRGGYHGLGYGALNATERDYFRRPFLPQLSQFGHFVEFPSKPSELKQLQAVLDSQFRKKPPGAILVEPVQTRGGINVPPPGFLPLLRRVCDENRALLVLDEVYTGFGRTGKWFACEHASVVPDLVCLGKALTGGFPLSACVGKAGIMDTAWPTSRGEAIHTSTFLGHPVGCAMALAQIREIRSKRLPERAALLGRFLLSELARLRPLPGFTFESRGIGLLIGLKICHANGEPATELVLSLVKGMLQRGLIALPEGESGNVLSFTPPLIVTKRQLQQVIRVLKTLLELSQSRTEAPTGRN